MVHKITPGIYIVIKVGYTLFAQNKQQQQQQQHNINNFDFKRLPNVTLVRY